MIRVIKFLVIVYHQLFPSRFGTCRYSPTCSQYLIDSVDKHGFFKGVYRSLIRVLSCHSLSKRPFYDPV